MKCYLSVVNVSLSVKSGKREKKRELLTHFDRFLTLECYTYLIVV